MARGPQAPPQAAHCDRLEHRGQRSYKKGPLPGNSNVTLFAGLNLGRADLFGRGVLLAEFLLSRSATKQSRAPMPSSVFLCRPATKQVQPPIPRQLRSRSHDSDPRIVWRCFSALQASERAADHIVCVTCLQHCCVVARRATPLRGMGRRSKRPKMDDPTQYIFVEISPRIVSEYCSKVRERLGLSPEWLTQLSSCLSCGKMHGLYRGPQDETEFRRLGMCEACRHILEDPSISVYVKWTQAAGYFEPGARRDARQRCPGVSTGQRELLEPFVGHRPDPTNWQ